jgi:predicted MFS family arabinose efflux permease
MAQAGDISMLGAGRALSGIGAATWVPLVVMFSSLYTPGQVLRSTGILAVAGGLGRIMATALTGTLNDLGGYSLAFNLAAVAALAAIFLVFLIPDERQPVRKFSLKKLENLVLNPLVVVPSLLSALLHYGDWSTWASFTPILARQYGGNDVMISLLVSLEMGFSLVGNLVSTMIVHRIGHRRMIYASFLVLTTGIGGLALAPSLGFVFAAQTCIGLAFGMAYPVLMGLSINKIEPEMQNSAMGLHQSVYSLGMFAGPWMSGILADALRIQPMLGITAGAVLLLSLIGIKKLRN